jgi:predicted cobalt transporter CbtA
MQASHGDHINANCLLFDALTLAGFVGSSGIAVSAIQALATEPIIYSAVFNTGAVLSHYQSRAPPPLLQL